MSAKRLSLNRELQTMLAEATEGLQTALGDALRQVVLFGSYARGTARPESDVDLLVVLDVVTPELENTVSRVAYDVMWRHDFRLLLSVLVLDEERYRSMIVRSYSLARSIEREGIVLWHRAA
ncbi:MAG: nucleotidyltransferase domain-containing protein [Chloroflexi bacterium]|nr:nucleotidyltransferase domain-containing protein [Chloroflexota bacterium]